MKSRGGRGSSGGKGRVQPQQEQHQPADEAGVAADALRSYGERFMSMFDDYDEQQLKAQRAQRKAAKQQQVEAEAAAAAAAAEEDGFAPSTSGRQGGRGEAGCAHHHHPPPGKGGKRGRPAPRDEIEEIIFDDKRRQPNGAGAGAGAGHGSADLLQDSCTLDMERRLFMSSKASKVHQAANPRLQSMDSRDEEEEMDPQLTPEEFKRLQLEVERLGASALDKRERKQWQAAMLMRMGAKPDKSPRTPACIGYGMAKKQASRESKKLEEAFETGMAQRKGMGKKKRAAAADGKSKDWGLQELGPGFKRGVMHVKRKGGGGGGSRGGGSGGGGSRGASKDAGPVRRMGGGKGGKAKKRPMKMPL